MADRRVVLVICDGHRRDFVRPELCPAIVDLARTGRRFDNHRGVFPSVTRTSSASIATGCHPARHGLHGNTMGLPEGDGVVVHDVGPPQFRDAMRRALGRTLKTPTLAERLRDAGGVIVFSNVSPGAAYFQDPDGHGHVYHRAGSFGPGVTPIAPLDIAKDASGDRAMAERFCGEVLRERRPPLAVLWLSDPDATMHAAELGGPEHLRSIASADSCVAQVRGTVDALRRAGEDILLMVGSDHGQETVTGAIEVDRLLVEAGLKDSLDSTDVAVASQGTSGLIYVAPRAAHRRAHIEAFVRAQDWVDGVFVGDGLAAIGMEPEGHLHMAFSMAKTDAANAHGCPGGSLIVAKAGAAEKLGLGQHGGTGRFEQAPFLTIEGSGFAPGTVCADPTCIIDIAPTALTHLGMSADDMDGRALQGR
ncbi:MAG: alkaline phosphatase family protein [Alphaproteobacteria bacterium]|nr:alkaline phosphatase family protein [Alphaproteobacteria bacterium]